MRKKLAAVAIVSFLLCMVTMTGGGVPERDVQSAKPSATDTPGVVERDAVGLDARTAEALSAWEQPLKPVLDRVKILRIDFLGNELWQYGIFLLVVFLSMAIGKLLEYFLSVKIKKITEKTRTQLDDIVVNTMSGPFKMVVVVIGIRLGSTLFYVSDNAQKALATVFEVLVAVVVAYAILKMVDAFVAYLEPRVKQTASKLDDQLLPVLGRTIKISIVVVAGIVVIQNLGYNVAGLLAGMGIGGLALAFAARETLSNLFGAVALFSDRPFQMGDRVVVEGNDGAVESIGLRSTRIRTLDGTLVTIPNAKMANSTINNIARRPTIKNLYTLGVTYDTGYEKMKKTLEIVRNIYKNHPSTDNYWAYFKEFGAHSLNILVIHWCKYLAYEEFLKATEDINMEIMKRFEAEGIEIAFPTQTIYVKSEEKD